MITQRDNKNNKNNKKATRVSEHIAVPVHKVM